jgi:hypothetical protein
LALQANNALGADVGENRWINGVDNFMASGLRSISDGGIDLERFVELIFQIPYFEGGRENF